MHSNSVMLLAVDQYGLIVQRLIDREAFQIADMAIAASQAFKLADPGLGLGELEELRKADLIADNTVVDAVNLVALALIDVACVGGAGCYEN